MSSKRAKGGKRSIGRVIPVTWDACSGVIRSIDRYCFPDDSRIIKGYGGRDFWTVQDGDSAKSIPVGYACGVRRKNRGEYRLIRYCVQRPFHRKGFGRALVEQLVSHAAILGCKRVTSYVKKDNEPSRRVLAACGFTETRVGYKWIDFERKL